MKIFPAIDIIDGKVVRLTRGDYGLKKDYPLTVLEAARNFKAQGAECLHIVDLDGAKSGFAENAQVIASVISETGLFAEVGGGIRSFKQIESYLNAGAGRVILGTAAVKNFDFCAEAAARYGEKIAVGVDANRGKVAVNGWLEETDINSFSFCKKLCSAGVKNVIYTDISRDGTLTGANLNDYKKLLETDGLKVYASGGIATLNDISALKKMGVSGAVLGKALYEGALDLKRVIKLAEE